jgi:hypothetical protein
MTNPGQRSVFLQKAWTSAGVATSWFDGGLARWFAHREPWAAATPEREWIYVRRGAPGIHG